MQEGESLVFLQKIEHFLLIIQNFELVLLDQYCAISLLCCDYVDIPFVFKRVYQLR